MESFLASACVEQVVAPEYKMYILCKFPKMFKLNIWKFYMDHIGFET